MEVVGRRGGQGRDHRIRDAARVFVCGDAEMKWLSRLVHDRKLALERWMTL